MRFLANHTYFATGWISCFLLRPFGVIFFFQAEDGIRDWSVTGVQTCALPIYDGTARPVQRRGIEDTVFREDGDHEVAAFAAPAEGHETRLPRRRGHDAPHVFHRLGEIGRASCRERGWMPVVDGVVKTKKRAEQ